MKGPIRLAQLVVVVVFLGATALALSYGPPLEYTGAPGEDNCTHCHTTNALNTGLGAVFVEGLPERYEPGRTYAVTVRVTHPTARRWGFQVTAIRDDGAGAGIFQSDQNSGVQALGPSLRHGRFYAEQSRNGLFDGQTGAAAWTFSWRAPESDVGPITFYAIGNATNGDNTDFYDWVYTTSVTVEGQRPTVRVRLVAPEPGTVLPAGEEIAIRWQVSDGEDADPVRLRVDLSTDSGMTFPTVLASDLPRTATSFRWSIPAGLETTRARLRVTVLDSLGIEHRDHSPFDLSIGPVGLDPDAGAIALPPGSVARAAEWTDLDADGRADLLVGRSSGRMLVFLRGADGGFLERGEQLGVSGEGELRAIAAGDYDQDGRIDVAAVGDGELFLYRNEGNGVLRIVGAPTAPSPVPDATSVAWLDVTFDGRLDLLVGSPSSLRVYANEGSAFRDVTEELGFGRAPARAIAVGPQIALGGASGVLVFERRGQQWAIAQSFGQADVGSVSLARWADVTGDGNPDLVLGGTATRVLSRTSSTAPYSDVTSALGLGALGAVKALDAADFDADGDLDLFATTLTGAGRVLRREAAAFEDISDRFELESGVLFGAWADADGGSVPDLLTFLPGQALLRRNPRPGGGALRLAIVTDADGNAESADSEPDRAAAGAIVRIDLDGDGDFATGRALGVVVGAAGLPTSVHGAEGAASTVRVDFASGETVARPLAAGASHVVGDPAAPRISSARLVTKTAGSRLVVDGDGLPVSGADVLVEGVKLSPVKAPAKFVRTDGTTARLVSKDSRVVSLVRPGAVIRIAVRDGGVLSPPYVVP